MKTFILFIAITLSQLNSDGWDKYLGKTVQIQTPLYVCGLYYDSLIVAPERMYVPEEHANGLADGDSTEYFMLKMRNQQMRIHLDCKYSGQSVRTGCRIEKLTAKVSGDRRLVTGNTPKFSHVKWPKHVKNDARNALKVCCANIQNYFTDPGGYAGLKTPEQFKLQTHKVAKGLVNINADIYAICEMERGNTAPRVLVNAMNKMSHTKRYAFVNNDGGDGDGDTISVCFIYKIDKVKQSGDVTYAYKDISNIYYHRFKVCPFEDLKTGERFIVSLNHPRSKRGDPWEANEKRMHNVDTILTCLQHIVDNNVYADEDILMVGDYNCYSHEQPIQTLIKAGYQDVLMKHDSTGYSYVYNAEMGYLDRVFANAPMAKQIVAIHPYHINTDTYYSLGYRSKYGKKCMYRYSDHDPIIIHLQLQSNK